MKLILSLILMALTTYLIRMIPFTLFSGKIKSRFVRSFLHYVPYAVLSAMTFPAIFYSTNSLETALCGTAVALVLAFFRQSLTVVALAAAGVVFVTSFFF